MTWRTAAAVLTLLGLLAAAAALPVRAQPVPSGLALATGLQALADAKPLPDPLPLRRVLLAADAPLPAAPEGNPFRPMPREEFEKRVQAAARNRVPPPALVQATYRATLTNDSLVGAGEWVVSGAGDAALPLDPLGVAVRGAKWPDGREALLWGSPAKLWVDRRGRTPVAFAWSARGVEEPGAVRFDLALPPAPLAVLELTLPTDRVPVANRGQLLTGPVPAGNQAAWRLAFGGDAKLELVIRRPAGAGLPAPLAAFARTAKFDLSPGVATVAVEFDTTAVRGPLTTLEFDADPALTVTNVTAPGLDGWQEKDGRVTATFREPLTAGVVTVVAVAVLPTGGEPWAPPTVRPVVGVLADDRVEAKLAPDVKLEGWTAGDYRLTRTATTDMTFALTFKGGLLPDGAAKRRLPALRLRTVAAEFTTVDALDWRIEPHRSQLTGRFRVTATRGPLTRLAFKVPAGFTPLAVVLTPDDATAAWSVVNHVLTLEPTQPIATGETAEVRIELRGPPPKFDPPALRLTWPAPVVAPVGAAKREGTLAVQVSPALRGWLSTTDPQPLKFTHDPAVTLTLAPGPAAVPGVEPPAEKPVPVTGAWRFGDLAFALTLDPDGRPRGVLTGVILEAADRSLVVGLPDGATVEEATVEKWADAEPVPGGVRLPVPPPDADGVPFALTYRLPPPDAGRPWRGRTLPTLPGDPPLRAKWTFDGARAWPTLATTADAELADGFVLVPAAWPTAVGYTFAAVLLGFVLGRLLAGRRPRMLMLLVVAALGAAVWLAPVGWRTVTLPPLATALVGVVALTVAARPSRIAALAVAAFATVPAVAQAPEAATVYFRPASATDPNRLTALVPQSVLDQLAAMAASPLPPVVVTGAEYTGKEADGAGQFAAAWTVHVTRDGPQTFALPLGGVKLEAMALDGAAAYPDASQPNVLHLTVTGWGRHDLTATFAVPVAATAGDRDLRFTAPDVPGSRLTFALGPGGRQPTLAGRAGGQTVTKADATTVQADLGRGTGIDLRWREGMTANSPPAATVTEATVWDVTETRAAATAAFVYQIGRGALSRLTFDLPPGLEPGAVAVRSASDAANGLRTWTLTPAANGHQTLALELQTPAEGMLAVSFRLTATAAPTHRPALRGPRATNADVTATYLGVRLPPGLTPEGWQNEHTVDFPADAVARDFALVPDFDFDKTVTRSLRRQGTGEPVARPVLRTPPAPVPASQELTWTLGPRAEVVGVARWPAGTATPFVECDVPAGVTLTDVTAADLAGWQRAGNRVRAWFKGETKDPTLRWAGAWPGYAIGAAVELPGVPNTTVRVRPADDFALVPQVGRATKLQPTPRPRETAYLQEADAPPKFVAHPPTPLALRETEAVARVGPTLEQRVTLDLRLAAGRPHSFTLQVSRLPAGADTRLEWPTGASVVESGSDATHRRWLATLAERPDAGVRVVVTNRFPARPEVTLPGVELLSANAAVAAPDHRLTAPDDWLPTPAGGYRRGPDGAWSVATDQPIRLVEAAKPAATAPAATAPAVAPPGGDGRLDPRSLAAVWLTGLCAVAVVARWGSDRWRPEVAAGFGLLAVAACGWAFAPVVGVGLVMRLLRVTRFVGHRVLR